MSAEDIIADIIRREGDEFTNRASDRGGPTKYGITLATLISWRGKPCTADDVRNLAESEAREIYRERYILAPGFNAISDEQVRAFAVDSAVQHGPQTAIKFLQNAAHVFADGILGPKSADAINRMTPSVLYRRACANRVRFYGAIVTNDPELVRARLAGWSLQAENAKGWANRIAEFIEATS